ncbi:MAG: formamidopyrimidine-DNA glycosylase [Planctomycetota bacterium]|nr:formamidopyrimidine-DNA glycosylase [Planctomycetota bacterium]
MPELPEVETMRRGLFPTIGGIITAVNEPDIPYRPIKIDPSIKEFRERVLGEEIIAVNRIAKRVLVKMRSGDSIVMQPKMAGIAMVSVPPSEQHTRMVFDLSGAAVPRFLYWDRRGLGTVSLWTEAQIEEQLGPNKLGPDASIVDQKTFAERFRATDREVKVAMLDQRVVCGIGNLYAAEILHAARVHPSIRCSDLSRSRWNRIHRETIRILKEAIEKEGSTLSDGTYRNAINGEGSYQNQYLVYDREDEKCLTCKKERIQRMIQAQRSTFFCPKCQG